MNCPHCGAEYQAGKVCGSCGKETVPLKEIEVRYKDFRVNEMLDIKIVPRSLPPQKATQPRITGNRETMGGEMPLPDKKPVSGGLSYAVITAVIITLVMILGFLAIRYVLSE